LIRFSPTDRLEDATDVLKIAKVSRLGPPRDLVEPTHGGRLKARLG
jgi:hypothetical protein